MTQIKTYARELANHLSAIASIQEDVKAVVDSAKNAGINVRALRKVAREMVIDSEKRNQIYEDEHQLSLFRSEVGLTERFAEAAE